MTHGKMREAKRKKSVALTHVSSDIFAILSGRCFDPETRAAFEGETNPYVKQG